MKKIVLAWMVALVTFTGCTEENYNGCITWKFTIDDTYAPGDFDSKLGNDVLFTIFNDGKAVSSFIIPYEDILDGEYIMNKPSNGAVVTAWGVPRADATHCYTPLPKGSRFESLYFEMKPQSSGTDDLPCSEQLYFGTNRFSEKDNFHEIKLHPEYCRVEVKVHSGAGGMFSAPGAAPNVQIQGITSKVNLHGEGIGEPFVKKATLATQPTDPSLYTALVAVMPSRADQSVSVDIMNGDVPIATLRAADTERIAATVGGYILFEYYPANGSVTVTVDDWDVKGEAVVM